MRSRRERPGTPLASRRHSRAVWVDLRRLYPQPRPPLQDRGLNLAEEVPGGLWEWVQASSGAWFGVVTFHVQRLDDPSHSFIADRQLVPAHALRPR